MLYTQREGGKEGERERTEHAGTHTNMLIQVTYTIVERGREGGTFLSLFSKWNYWALGSSASCNSGRDSCSKDLVLLLFCVAGSSSSFNSSPTTSTSPWIMMKSLSPLVPFATGPIGSTVQRGMEGTTLAIYLTKPSGRRYTIRAHHALLVGNCLSDWTHIFELVPPASSS